MFLWKQKPIFTCILWVSSAIRDMNQVENVDRNFLKKEWIKTMMSPCILVIDNDVKLLVNLEAVLNRAGYRVLTAHDDRQALYLAQAARPEVIICDVTRRSQNNVDVRRTLAQDSQTASIPFIPLTKDRQELVARVNATIRSQSCH